MSILGCILPTLGFCVMYNQQAILFGMHWSILLLDLTSPTSSSGNKLAVAARKACVAVSTLAFVARSCCGLRQSYSNTFQQFTACLQTLTRTRECTLGIHLPSFTASTQFDPFADLTTSLSRFTASSA